MYVSPVRHTEKLLCFDKGKHLWAARSILITKASVTFHAFVSSDLAVWAAAVFHLGLKLSSLVLLLPPRV